MARGVIAPTGPKPRLPTNGIGQWECGPTPWAVATKQYQDFGEKGERQPLRCVSLGLGCVGGCLYKACRSGSPSPPSSLAATSGPCSTSRVFTVICAMSNFPQLLPPPIKWLMLSTAIAVLSFSSEWLFDLNRRCECAVVASGTQLFPSRLHNQWLSAIPALIN